MNLVEDNSAFAFSMDDFGCEARLLMTCSDTMTWSVEELHNLTRRIKRWAEPLCLCAKSVKLDRPLGLFCGTAKNAKWNKARQMLMGRA